MEDVLEHGGVDGDVGFFGFGDVEGEPEEVGDLGGDGENLIIIL